MAWPYSSFALSFDGYLKVLRQLDRPGTLPQSALSVLLRSHHRGNDHRSQLAAAERIAAVLTAEQRHASGRAGWPKPELLAAEAGMPAEAIDRLVFDFDQVSMVAGQYVSSGPWRRLVLLAHADPLLAWLKGRLRPSSLPGSRTTERG